LASYCKILPAASIHLDAGLLDHLGVLRHLGSKVSAELLRRAGSRVQALGDELVAHVGHAQGLVDLRVEPRDNRGY